MSIRMKYAGMFLLYGLLYVPLALLCAWGVGNLLMMLLAIMGLAQTRTIVVALWCVVVIVGLFAGAAISHDACRRYGRNHGWEEQA